MEKERETQGNLAFQAVLKAKEQEANIVLAWIVCIMGITTEVLCLIFSLHILRVVEALVTYQIILGLCSIATGHYCLVRKGKVAWCKHLLTFWVLCIIVSMNLITANKLWILYAIPIVLSVRYFDLQFTHVAFVTCCLGIVFNVFANAYLLPDLGIFDLNTVILEPNAVISMNGSHWLYRPVLTHGVNLKQMLVTSLFVEALPNLLGLMAILFICIEVIRHMQERMITAIEKYEQLRVMELTIAKDKQELMLSQVQPHFIYNVLSAIMAIDGNPDETVDYIGAVGKYLRKNMILSKRETAILMSEELEHVERYISLENLRFDNKIKVHYDLTTNDFEVPPLTVQILVENAIKHGISIKEEGGNVWISTKELEDEYLITVRDDGVGFDSTKPIDEKLHFGLANLKGRLEMFCQGSMDVESAVELGTCVNIHIPKKGGERV